jgi:KamA family protein
MPNTDVDVQPIAFRHSAEHEPVRYVTDLAEVKGIPRHERAELQRVADRYAFRANDYYLGLIDWDDPADPIRKLIIPRSDELDDWGALDASNEAGVTVGHGVQHKYRHTVLLLCNEVCGAFCRYCFRKRLFMDGNDEVSIDVSKGIRYIAEHPEVTNVLLTGGDPLLMSTIRLRRILEPLRAIPHVTIIRIGTKMPAFNPWRVLDDPKLLELVGRYSTAGKRIYFMTHFDHPRELTRPAVEALAALKRAGAMLANQCPLVAGVNDDPLVLGRLFRRLAAIGAPQYYVFQGRPTAGNKPYEVPIVRGYRVFRDACTMTSGLGRRARFCMSHATGKIAVVGVDENHIYLRYHRAKDPRDEFRFMVFERDDEAYWLDQLVPAR